MDFTIETQELQRIAKILGHVARSASDITGRISIEAKENNEVVFIANRGAIGVQITSNKATVKNPGLITPSYGRIKSFIFSFMPWVGDYGTKEFHFISKGDDIYIHVNTVYEGGKKSKGKLKLDNTTVHNVKAPEPFGKADFILNSNIIRDAVNKVLYSIDPGEQRTHVKGMNITFDAKYIYFAGTNGRMLSEYKVNNTSSFKKGSFVVEHDFINGLKAIIGEDTQLFFEFDTDVSYPKVKVMFGDVYYWGKQVIGADFPDYNELLAGFSNTIVLKKDVIMNTLSSLMDVLNPDDYNRITFEIKDNKVLLYSDFGDFEYDGGEDCDVDFVIDLNGNYLRQTVEAIKDDTIVIKFSDDNGLFIFDSDNFENQKALITPVKRR